MLSSMLRRGSRALPATASRVGGQTRSTTILSVRKGDQVFLIGDGQVSIGSQMVKSNARKVRTSPLPPPAPPRSRRRARSQSRANVQPKMLSHT